MHEVTVFRTKDGYTFNSRSEAMQHEALVDYCWVTLRSIKVQESNVESGLQNTDLDLAMFDMHFKKLLAMVSLPLLENYLKNPRGIIGRFLSDSTSPSHKVLNDAYYRGVLCVGKDGKSYSQPYFANKTWEY